MSQIPAHLPPAVAKSLREWHVMVERQDFRDLPSLLRPDSVFRSPMSINPYRSADAVLLALRTVSQVFENFTYHRQFSTDDGLNVVLEFSANLGDKNLKGADYIRFDAAGKMLEFEVMIRPFNALQVLGAEMSRRIGHLMPSYKGRDEAAVPG